MATARWSVDLHRDSVGIGAAQHIAARPLNGAHNMGALSSVISVISRWFFRSSCVSRSMSANWLVERSVIAPHVGIALFHH